MKVLITVCLCALVSFVVAAPADGYSDKYDNTNVEEILNNRRLLLPYIKCALEQGKCSSEAKELRDHLKEALETDCAKCTDKQKETGAVIFKHLINNEKDYWTQLVDKYDPEKKYAPAFEKEYLPQ